MLIMRNYSTTNKLKLRNDIRNPTIHNIRYIARESLSLDMRARDVRATNGEKNFLGYELDDNDRLVKNKTYGGNSD